MAQKRRRRGRRHRKDPGEVPSLPEPRPSRPECTTIPEPARWWITAAVWGLPALAAAAVYANTLSNEIAYDECWTLKLIPSLSVANLLDALQRSRGLTYAVHSLDKWLWGAWMPGFHITNVILHALASALAAYVALKLTSSRRIALLCGLLFAVHPVHVEVVASFPYRKDMLAMIFVSLALILWLGPRRPWICYIGSLVCLGLGVVSKEVAAIGLVPMLFLADLLPGHGHAGRWRSRLYRAVWRSVPFVALAIIATTRFAGDVTARFTKDSIYRTTEGQHSEYSEVLATSAGSVPDVARLLFVPLTLSVDYPPRPQERLSDARPLAGISMVVLWLVSALFLTRRHSVAAFAMVWVLVMYLPCSNIVPLTHFSLAERYLYVPSFGICLLLAMGFDRTLRSAARCDSSWARIGARAAAALLIAAFGARCVLRNMDWRDEYSLWSSVFRDGFVTWRAHDHLGCALVRRHRFSEALVHYRSSQRLGGHSAHIQYEMGVCLLAEGKTDQASQAFREAIRIEPGNASSHIRLGAALGEQGKLVEAVAAYRTGLRLNPNFPAARFNLGNTLKKQGRLDDAITLYREILRGRPDAWRARCNLGNALYQQGKMDEAIQEYRQAWRDNPGEPIIRGALELALFNLGNKLRREGKFYDAITAYREVLTVSPGLWKTRCNLGNVLFQQGETDEAILEYRHALRIKPDDPTIRRALEQALAKKTRSAKD